MTQTQTVTEDEFVEYDPVDQFKDAAGDIRDPYPDLAAQRAENAIHLVNLPREMGLEIDPEAPPPKTIYTVFTHDLVRQVLADNENFSSSGYSEFVGQVMGHTILEMDAPEHPRHRNLVARAFRPRLLETFGDQVVTATVNELIDAFAADGRADLVRQLTFPFPVKVISRILGLPDSDWNKFQRWSIELISMGVNWQRSLRASAALRDYFAGIVAQRREEPRDDLISQLVVAEVDGARLADEDIYSFLRLLLPAGAETTYRSSGNLLYALLTYPDQLDALRADRSLLPQAIEEGLRWEPPLLFIQREVVRDTELGGMVVPKGSMVAVSLGAANRDPARHEDPDRFDIFRDARQHISFGAGPHLCLGMHLARLETRIALNAILDRLPNLRLDPAVEDVHIHGMMFRAPTALPVLFDA